MLEVMYAATELERNGRAGPSRTRQETVRRTHTLRRLTCMASTGHLQFSSVARHDISLNPILQ